MVHVAVLVAALGLVPKVVVPTSTHATIVAADGLTLAADVFAAGPSDAPVILLFHQAGSSKAEYAPIAPRLALAGFRTIAIDQRSGGDLYAPPNSTVAARGRSAPYLDVLRDIDATVTYARRAFPAAPVYLWGSSYSASLAIVYASRHPRGVAAVLAFSPGEYFTDKRLVRRAARGLRMPVFIDSANDPAEIRAAREIGDATRSRQRVRFVPHAGVHGSSTLRDDRDAAGAAENWDAVFAFLTRVRSGG